MADAWYAVSITSNGPTNAQHVNPYVTALGVSSLGIGFWNSANSLQKADPIIACVQVFGN
jgi:hypothetical protein